MFRFPRTAVLAAIVGLFAIATTAVAQPVNQANLSESQSGLTVRGRLPALARDGYVGTIPYTVQSGDTLFSIAQRHGTTVASVAAMNGIADPSQIKVGMVLYVPPIPPPPPPPPTGPSELIRNGPRTTNRLALTFDLGGRVEPALDIMNWLIANNVPSTIFPTGSMLESPNTEVGRQVMAIIESNPDVFELGNHSYSHPDFRDLTAAQIAAELRRAEEAAAQHSDLPMKPRFRPPFGGYDQRVLEAVGAAGYAQTIMWDVDTIDWRPEADGGPTAQQIVTKVLTNAQGGSIVLMHLGGFNTLDALPQMVAALRANGLEPAKVSTVLGQ